jgi:pimeloyl-ACP methyl ester carboxylesterase
MKKHLGFLIIFFITARWVSAQPLPGFKPSGSFNEQQMLIENSPSGTRMLINAPLTGFGDNDRMMLVFYALPNGNTIEHTFGKKMRDGDDWHFDIQHIGAQTRFLRHVISNRTIVVAYLENKRKSWPAWTTTNKDYREQVNGIVDDVKSIFAKWDPEVLLNGHSGGGRFIFDYLDVTDDIPDDVVRIAFLDSDYGYEDTIYGPKLVRWLKSDKDKYLCTLAYNDSVVIYNGKPLVSPTGGTWYRSRMMKAYLEKSYRFRGRQRDSLIWYTAADKRIEIILKTNPEGKIFHTQQVEYNGFIHSILSGTRYEQRGYRYFEKRAYSDLIADTVIIPIRRMNIPARDHDAETGSAFMRRINDLPLAEREEEIFKAAVSGNIPDFLRNTITLQGEFEDAEGVSHRVTFEVMPDYLSIGSDDDFCRIPMNPMTAQRLAYLFGASLLTARLSDFIYDHSEVKLTPFNYIPVGNANELVTKFVDHNAQVERQLAEAGGKHGQLVAGIQKDVILSVRIAERPDRVVIYGWHKSDGKPIQPVYNGHVWWYVDYSHGIRFINDQVLIDGKPALFSEIIKDPVLYKIFSNEDRPMEQPFYPTVPPH